MNLSRLKRFDKGKHDQLEGLLQWCQLLGLTGKDLISLGGHIDRMQVREQIEANKKIVQGFQLDRVGRDSAIEHRFTIKTVNGRYLFEDDTWGKVSITSYKTKVNKTFYLGEFELGRMHWRNKWVYRAILSVSSGQIVLDF